MGLKLRSQPRAQHRALRPQECTVTRAQLPPSCKAGSPAGKRRGAEGRKSVRTRTQEAMESVHRPGTAIIQGGEFLP